MGEYSRLNREADLVIHNGKVVKNRFGDTGGKAPLPDGHYKVERLEMK